MKIGSTFLRKDSDRHLWVVLSDPEKDPDTVLLVNLTSYTPLRERACLLNRGDHPWISKETCVNYNDDDATVTTLKLLFAAKDGGAIDVQESLTEPVLKRVLEGAANSTRLSLEKAAILEKQGLILI